MHANELIERIAEIVAIHGNLHVRHERPEGPITCATPSGFIWEVRMVEHSWGKEIVIFAG